MEVISNRRSSSSSSSSSTLNANAPMFVPLAYLAVEDFSDEWWHLVQSSPWFRDYWLRECFQDSQYGNDPPFSDFEIDDPLLLPDHPQEDEGEEEGGKELVTMGALKWRRGAGWAEAPRYAEKAPKIVKYCRVSPRTIRQPR